MMDQYDVVAKITKTIATSSAMNPTLLLSALALLPSLAFLFFSDGIKAIFFAVICASILSSKLWQFWKFTREDPDRLKNDRHVENRMMIATLGVKRGENLKEITLSPQIVNTADPQITAGGRSEQVCSKLRPSGNKFYNNAVVRVY